MTASLEPCPGFTSHPVLGWPLGGGGSVSRRLLSRPAPRGLHVPGPPRPSGLTQEAQGTHAHMCSRPLLQPGGPGAAPSKPSAVSLGSEASSAACAASAPAPCSWQPPGHGQREAQLGASLGWVPQECQCPLSLASRRASSRSSLGALRPLDWVGTLEDVAGTWQPPLKAEVAPGGPGGAGRGLQQVRTRPTLGPGLGLRLPVAWAGAGSVSSTASFQPWRASGQLVLHPPPVSWLRQGLLSAKHSCCARGGESQVRGEPACGPGGKLVSAARRGLLQGTGGGGS